MTQPFKQWTVLPHGKLVPIDENILTVVGEIHMPLMDLPRRMTVMRLADVSLMVYSAIALDEDEMTALEGYASRAQVPAWAEIDSRVRVLVLHGSPIEDKPRQVLRELAGSLA